MTDTSRRPIRAVIFAMDGVFCAAQGQPRPTVGAVEFITWCRQLGLKIAIVTSADLVRTQDDLRQINLPPEMFDAIVTSPDTDQNKPAPDMFLQAARRMGVDPAHCLAVEDTPDGIQAAKSAGCKCLALTTSFTEAELLAAGAAWTSPHLAAVPEGILEIE